MSLKSFHVVFIVAAILLSLVMALWSFTQYQSKPDVGYLLTIVCSIGLAIGLAIYEINFLKKSKSL